MSSPITAAISTGIKSENELTRVGQVTLPQINENQILVKTRAFAFNPTDWKHLEIAQEGFIAGSDAAGVVEEVGSNVTKFKKGDVVSSFIRGNVSKEKGAFAEYTIVEQNTTIKHENGAQFKSDKLAPGSYPSGNIDSFEGAAAVTLGLSTVALSFSHSLKINLNKDANKNSSILIWSGATATGILAIQVAKLVYGLQVITTASPKNYEFLKSLGADAVFDYHDADVTQQIDNYAKGSIAYALDTISSEYSFQQVYDSTASSKEVSIDNLLGLQPSQIKTDSNRKVNYGFTLAYVVWGKDVTFGPVNFKSSPELVKNYNHFFEEVLPPYIKDIKHSNLKVIEPGFESVATGLELLRQNKVSGEKVVFNTK